MQYALYLFVLVNVMLINLQTATTRSVTSSEEEKPSTGIILTTVRTTLNATNNPTLGDENSTIVKSDNDTTPIVSITTTEIVDETTQSDKIDVEGNNEATTTIGSHDFDVTTVKNITDSESDPSSRDAPETALPSVISNIQPGKTDSKSTPPLYSPSDVDISSNDTTTTTTESNSETQRITGDPTDSILSTTQSVKNNVGVDQNIQSGVDENSTIVKSDNDTTTIISITKTEMVDGKTAKLDKIDVDGNNEGTTTVGSHNFDVTTVKNVTDSESDLSSRDIADTAPAPVISSIQPGKTDSESTQPLYIPEDVDRSSNDTTTTTTEINSERQSITENPTDSISSTNQSAKNNAEVNQTIQSRVNENSSIVKPDNDTTTIISITKTEMVDGKTAKLDKIDVDGNNEGTTTVGSHNFDVTTVKIVTDSESDLSSRDIADTAPAPVISSIQPGKTDWESTQPLYIPEDDYSDDEPHPVNNVDEVIIFEGTPENSMNAESMKDNDSDFGRNSRFSSEESGPKMKRGIGDETDDRRTVVINAPDYVEESKVEGRKEIAVQPYIKTKAIDFDWSAERKKYYTDRGLYNPSIITPSDFAVDNRNRMFLALGNREDGPCTVAYFTDNDSNQVETRYKCLTAEPPKDSNKNPDEMRCTEIVSVYKLRIDKCNRLWFVDTNVKNGYYTNCPAKLMAYNLETDKIELSVPIPKVYARNKKGFGLLVNLVVEPGDRCSLDKTKVFIADTLGYALIVYEKPKFRRIENVNYFGPEPGYTDVQIADETRRLENGIFSLALSEDLCDKVGRGDIKSCVSNFLYYRPLASLSIYLIDKCSVNEADNCLENRERRFNIPSQSTDFILWNQGILFYTLTKEPSIGCINTRRDSKTRNSDIIRIKTDFLFIAALKIVTIGGTPFLYALMHKQSSYRPINVNEYNYYVYKIPIKDLIEGTRCA